MTVNRFFSSVVRIQADRGQHVIDGRTLSLSSGTRAISAGILIMLASGLALGSWIAAALLIVLSLPFLLHRAIPEDRVLQAELPGYRDYAHAGALAGVAGDLVRPRQGVCRGRVKSGV